MTIWVGVGAVMVAAVIPAQEQALRYAAAEEQSDAYGGTLVGVSSTWRPSSARSRKGAAVMVTVTNWDLYRTGLADAGDHEGQEELTSRPG